MQDPKLIVFLAFAAVALIMNTLIILLAYKALANMTTKITEGAHEFQSSTGTRELLKTLQSASEQAVKATTVVKEQIAGLEPAVDRMHAAYGEGLSRADVRFKLLCQAAHFAAEKTEMMVKWPVRNVLAVSSGIQGIIAFIRGSESGPDASSRRSR